MSTITVTDGTTRIAKVVLMGSVTPLMLQTTANPGGLPIDAFDKIRAGVAADRSQFFKDLATLFFGASALISAQLVKDATVKIYPGGPHGLADTHQTQVNEDMLTFLTS